MNTSTKSFTWQKKDIVYIMVTFFYIFYFRLQRVPILSKLESTTMLGIFLFLFVFLSKKMEKQVSILLAKKSTQYMMLACLGLITLAGFITIIHGQFEFSICRPLFHQFMFIVVGILFYAFIKSRNRADYIFEYIIIAYVIQSFVQYAAFLNPTFNAFTDMFKTEDIIILKLQYDGFRLNAISGGLAFSLAGAYAIVTTIYVFRWNEIKFKKGICKVFVLIVLLAGGLAAGRTAILLDALGFAALAVINIYKKKKMATKKSTMKLILALPAIGFMGILLIPKLLGELGTEFIAKLGTVGYWLTKWTSEYFRVGNTGSNYDFWDTNYSVFKQIGNAFLGDGIYTNMDGTYYLRQDAGYIRMIAFGGIVWALAMFAYQLMFLYTGKKRFYENLVILMMILIGTLKADCLAIDLQIQLILIITFMANKEEAIGEGLEREGVG